MAPLHVNFTLVSSLIMYLYLVGIMLNILTTFPYNGFHLKIQQLGALLNKGIKNYLIQLFIN